MKKREPEWVMVIKKKEPGRVGEGEGDREGGRGREGEREGGREREREPYAPHPTPYTLHPTPYTLHPRLLSITP